MAVRLDSFASCGEDGDARRLRSSAVGCPLVRVIATLFATGLLAAAAAPEVFRYGRFEQAFTAAQDYSDPLKDVKVEVEFSGPEKFRARLPAFWDGGRTWRVRFSPEREGLWSFRVLTPGFTPTQGSFRAQVYRGPNELLRRGAPRVSANRRHFVHADGTPWFWLADTAWNGALMSTDVEWREYLADRAAKRFTAVQFVMTQWRAGLSDELGQTAFAVEGGRLSINPAFFQRMDRKLEAVAEQGLVSVPVMLWALTSPAGESPGEALPEEQAALLASYIAARYDAFPVMWLLGGDGDYRAEKAERWRKIGRAVFPEGRPRRPVTLHPRGMHDPWPLLKDEPWLDFLMFQTGHGSDEKKWRWHATQGLAAAWRMEPPRPVIDGEPNYEGHVSYAGEMIGDDHVRRAVYYSLLLAPTAGVTYGAHGIWFWARKPEVPLNHPRSGVAQPWRECLNYPGGTAMRVMREIFDSIPWWRLRPDRSLLGDNPVDAAFSNYIAAARSDEGDFALLYLPRNESVRLNLTGVEKPARAIWIDPRTGRRTPASKVAGAVELKTPGAQDWLLLLDWR